MRSPRAAFPAATLLASLAFGLVISQASSSAAAPRCPSGQILRVSRGVCVPKAQNLALMARHGTKKRKPADVEDEVSSPVPPKPAREKAAKSSDRPDEKSADVAQGEAPAPPVPPSPPAEESTTSRLLSPFGALFVGAFRSTLSTGMAAFR
ncbi:MAG: hypothetical protein JO004_06590 [Methylobacteriaceae bacterium]|nr:hypothetical protein [Methylobacteriaceae bacterium]